MVAKILCFMLIVGVASAATWIGRPAEKPVEFADKEGCYIKEINDVVPYGSEVKPIGHCYRIECSRSFVDYASCGVAYTDDRHCHITDTDLSQPYPDCCPTIKCDLDNNLI